MYLVHLLLYRHRKTLTINIIFAIFSIARCQISVLFVGFTDFGRIEMYTLLRGFYRDFTAVFTALKLEVKQQENIFKKMEKAQDKWMEHIAISFLSPDFKEAFVQLIQERFCRLKV